jgi:4-diphosphocytidyl-2-C-methyl-D-erythritol kinase
MSGNAIPGNAEDNLCLKAYALLKKDFDIPPVKIHLHKIIPTGAGLGGGSSDAAFSLRILNDLFALNLPADQLVHYAVQLGSDCAFFLQDKEMIGTGRGEKLTPYDVALTGKYLLLVNPEIHVSTADAYASIKPQIPTNSVESILTQPLAYWKQHLVNDFEESVFRKFSGIDRIKNQLYSLGAEYASMSGSGSTVFGIFDNDPSEIVKQFPDFSCWAGQLS